MKTFVIPVGGLMVALMMATGCGDDSTGDCTPNDHTACMQDITYWMDSCGSQGTVAEICDCGCSVDFTGCDQSCSCTPDCSGKECGDDGCGGNCGGCNSGETCTTAGQCISCTPDCAGRVCGDNGCQGSCGDCQTDENCSAAGQCETTIDDMLIFNNCDVPFVLDSAEVSNLQYMTTHFEHLIQDYCITGGFDGNNIADMSVFDERMYYGQHDAGNTLSLVQLSMNGALEAEWSVKVDFIPDTEFITGSSWTAAIGGLNPPEALVGLIRHLGGSSQCIKAIGTTGIINVASAVDCTLQEGGSFVLSGQVQLTNPWDITDYCSQTPPNLPCCP